MGQGYKGKHCEKELNGNKSCLCIHEVYCKDNPNKKVRGKRSASKKQLEHLEKIRKASLKKGGWKCKHCDCVFESSRLLMVHNQKMHSEFCNKQRRQNIQCKCIYCHKILPSSRKLAQHIKDECCVTKTFKKDSLGRIISPIGHRNAGRSLKERYDKGEIKSVFSNPDFWTAERRASVAKWLRKRLSVGSSCNYNEKACKYIDELNKMHNWNLKHALNGGEFKVGPYSLDGYDEELNIAFEYDEPKHHKSKKIEEHDKKRAEYIMSILKCRFFRYDEQKDIFYEITSKN